MHVYALICVLAYEIACISMFIKTLYGQMAKNRYNWGAFTSLHTCIRIYIQTYIHAYIYTDIYLYTFICIHIHIITNNGHLLMFSLLLFYTYIHTLFYTYICEKYTWRYRWYGHALQMEDKQLSLCGFLQS